MARQPIYDGTGNGLLDMLQLLNRGIDPNSINPEPGSKLRGRKVWEPIPGQTALTNQSARQPWSVQNSPALPSGSPAQPRKPSTPSGNTSWSPPTFETDALGGAVNAVQGYQNTLSNVGGMADMPSPIQPIIPPIQPTLTGTVPRSTEHEIRRGGGELPKFEEQPDPQLVRAMQAWDARYGKDVDPQLRLKARASLEGRIQKNRAEAALNAIRQMPELGGAGIDPQQLAAADPHLTQSGNVQRTVSRTAAMTLPAVAATLATGGIVPATASWILRAGVPILSGMGAQWASDETVGLLAPQWMEETRRLQAENPIGAELGAQLAFASGFKLDPRNVVRMLRGDKEALVQTAINSGFGGGIAAIQQLGATGKLDPQGIAIAMITNSMFGESRMGHPNAGNPAIPQNPELPPVAMTPAGRPGFEFGTPEGYGRMWDALGPQYREPAPAPMPRPLEGTPGMDALVDAVGNKFNPKEGGVGAKPSLAEGENRNPVATETPTTTATSPEPVWKQTGWLLRNTKKGQTRVPVMEDGGVLRLEDGREVKKGRGTYEPLPQSTPIRAYHGTSAEFYEFRKGGVGIGAQNLDLLGPHFGTEKAATDRLRQYNTRGLPDSAQVISVDLNAQRILTKANGEPFTESELRAYIDRLTGRKTDYGRTVLSDGPRNAREILRERGYDLIAYKNAKEDRGSTSYIVLDENIISPIESRNLKTGSVENMGDRKSRMSAVENAEREAKDRIWQIPREQYIAEDLAGVEPGSLGDAEASYRKMLSGQHRRSVEQAIVQGKPVPPEVLKDYPDLTSSINPSKDVPNGKFSLSKNLTREQKLKLLANKGDAYVDNNAPTEVKGYKPNGDEIIGYVHSPELFHQSQSTGRGIRHYVTIGGNKVHVSDVFPELSDRMISILSGESAPGWTEKETIRNKKWETGARNIDNFGSEMPDGTRRWYGVDYGEGAVFTKKRGPYQLALGVSPESPAWKLRWLKENGWEVARHPDHGRMIPVYKGHTRVGEQLAQASPSPTAEFLAEFPEYARQVAQSDRVSDATRANAQAAVDWADAQKIAKGETNANEIEGAAQVPVGEQPEGGAGVRGQDAQGSETAGTRQAQIPQEEVGKQPWEMTQEEYVKATTQDVSPERLSDLNERSNTAQSDPLRVATVFGSDHVGLGAPDIAGKTLDTIAAQSRVALKRHERLVRDAVARGENVPPEVLADYPDLQPNSNDAGFVPTHRAPDPAGDGQVDVQIVRQNEDGTTTVRSAEGEEWAVKRTYPLESKPTETPKPPKDNLSGFEREELARLKAERKELIARYGTRGERGDYAVSLGALNPQAVRLYAVRDRINVLGSKARGAVNEPTIYMDSDRARGNNPKNWPEGITHNIRWQGRDYNLSKGSDGKLFVFDVTEKGKFRDLGEVKSLAEARKLVQGDAPLESKPTEAPKPEAPKPSLRDRAGRDEIIARYEAAAKEAASGGPSEAASNLNPNVLEYVVAKAWNAIEDGVVVTRDWVSQHLPKGHTPEDLDAAMAHIKAELPRKYGDGLDVEPPKPPTPETAVAPEGGEGQGIARQFHITDKTAPSKTPEQFAAESAKRWQETGGQSGRDAVLKVERGEMVTPDEAADVLAYQRDVFNRMDAGEDMTQELARLEPVRTRVRGEQWHNLGNALQATLDERYTPGSVQRRLVEAVRRSGEVGVDSPEFKQAQQDIRDLTQRLKESDAKLKEAESRQSTERKEMRENPVTITGRRIVSEAGRIKSRERQKALLAQIVANNAKLAANPVPVDSFRALAGLVKEMYNERGIQIREAATEIAETLRKQGVDYSEDDIVDIASGYLKGKGRKVNEDQKRYLLMQQEERLLSAIRDAERGITVGKPIPKRSSNERIAALRDELRRVREGMRLPEKEWNARNLAKVQAESAKLREALAKGELLAREKRTTFRTASEEVLRERKIRDSLRRAMDKRIYDAANPETVMSKGKRYSRAVQLTSLIARIADLTGNTAKVIPVGHGVASNAIAKALLFATKSEPSQVLAFAPGKNRYVLEGFRKRWRTELADAWRGVDDVSEMRYGNASIPEKMASMSDIVFKDYHARSAAYDSAMHLSKKYDVGFDEAFQQIMDPDAGGPLPPEAAQEAHQGAKEWAAANTYNNDNVVSVALEGARKGARRAVLDKLAKGGDVKSPGRFAREVADAVDWGLDIMTRFSRVIGNVALEQASAVDPVFGTAQAAGTAIRDLWVHGKLRPVAAKRAGQMIAFGAYGMAARFLGEYIYRSKDERSENGGPGLGWRDSVIAPSIIQRKNQEGEAGVKYVDQGQLGRIGGGLVSQIVAGYTSAMVKDALRNNAITDKDAEDMEGELAAWRIALDTPAMTGPQRLFEAFGRKGDPGQYVGNTAASLSIPAELNNIADIMDRVRNNQPARIYKDTAFGAAIKRIPRLRENLPEGTKDRFPQ